ncbi:MAG: diguanylate cyclase [Acidaminobacteraceae bacterium]
MKIKYQLLITHGLLVVLSLIIVLSNVVAYIGMESDASIINESGKLRALSYNMVQLTNQINNHDYDYYYDYDYAKLNGNLQYRIDKFDSILKNLNGNNKIYNLEIRDDETLLKLEQIIKKWDEVFKPSYIKVLENQLTNELYLQLNNEIDSYVNEIDEMVTTYSLYSRSKVNKALTLNGGLLFLIIIVTIYSLVTTNKRIQVPMKILVQELKDLSLLDDEVSNKLNNINTDEISEMKKYFDEMMYDQLTRTFNRRSGLAQLNKMFQYDNRRHLEISLCFIDINGLKIVNDHLGHNFGDELIISVIDCIKKEIRDEDYIIRMGGDEFLIVFKNITSEISENIWSRITRSYQFINENEDRPYIISVSHGIVEYDNFEKSEVELLIRNADAKMYSEKKLIKKEENYNILKQNGIL